MNEDILNLCDEDDEVPPMETEDDFSEDIEVDEDDESLDLMDFLIDTAEDDEETEAPEESEEIIETEVAEEPAPTEEVQENVSDEFMKNILEKLDSVLEKNEKLERQVAQLSYKVDESNRAVKAHENIEKRMNDELEKHRKNLYASIAEPFINQFIVIHNSFMCDLAECQRDFAKLPEDETEEKAILEELINTLNNYIQMIEGSFCNCGVEVYRPETDIPVDDLRCCIVGTIASDDVSKHGYIESVLSCGYTYNNKILRQAKVKVYKSK